MGPMEAQGRYELQLTMRVVRVNEHGGYYYNNNHDALSVEDKLVVNAAGFLEIAAILGRFHDLAEELKKGKVNDGSR